MTITRRKGTYINLERLLRIVQEKHGDIQDVQLAFARKLRCADVVGTTGATERAPRDALDHRDHRLVTEQPDSYH